MACGAARAIEANGLRLQLHEWGPPGRPPALLLHSLAAHSHWWDWSAPLLAERFFVAVLDLRGHGGSAWSDPPAYRAADYAADVVAVLDALGWRSPLVIGHSLGGYVGAYLAARYPERVCALVIADTMTQWSDDEAAWAQRQVDRPGPEFANASEAGSRYRLSPSETRAPGDWIRHLGETAVVERKPGLWQYAVDRRVFAHARPDAWPILPGVVCPTLAVRGAGSPLMDRDAWVRVATSVQQGQFAEIKDAWHHLVLDDPAGFVSTVTTWLDRVAPPRPVGRE